MTPFPAFTSDIQYQPLKSKKSDLYVQKSVIKERKHDSKKYSTQCVLTSDVLSKEISAYALNDMLLIQTVICINFLHINTKNQNTISSHDRMIINNDDPGALTMPALT